MSRWWLLLLVGCSHIHTVPADPDDHRELLVTHVYACPKDAGVR